MVRLVNQSYEYTEPPLYQKIMPVYYQNYYHTINNLHTQLLLQQQHQPPPPLEQQPQQHQPQQQHHLLLQSPLTTSVNVTTTPPPQQSLLPLPNTVMPSAILNTNHLYANNYHMNHQLHKNFVSDTNFNNYKKLNGGSGGGGGGGVICSPAAATSAVAMVQPQLATKNSIFINGNSGVGCSSDGAIYSSSSSSSSSNSSCCQVSDNSSNGGSVVGATTTMTIATINVGESGGGGSVSDDEKICNNNDSNLNIVTTKNNCITSSSTFSSPTTTTTICSMATSFLPPCNKRGSDELLSQAAIMAPASDNNNQDLASKKVKLETNSTVLGGVGKPSRVIHIRNIPNESSETEVIQLGVSFGRVTNVLVLKGKNQAFLEMADEVSAAAIVACFNSNPPQVRGRTVYVQFSNHRELKTDQSHSVANTTVALLNQDYQVTSPSSGSPLPISGTDPISHSVQNNHPGSPNTVLRVIVESLIYPVSLDILHQIFQRFGKVLKIVTFTKNNSFQALIQYPDAQTAQHAKAVLDGQNIYNGCCTLRIDNSKLTALNVKYNNDKSRDFTNPTLPPGEPGSEIIASAGGLMNANDLLLIAARQRPTITGDRLVNGLGTPGVLPPFALGLGTSLGGAYGGGIPSLGAFALTTTANLGATNPAALRGFSNVLLISNLNEEMVTPDALFTLFGVYGDVQRVKILYNKKDSALIQMAEPHQAYLAMTHLDKLRLWGKSIRVMASKHQAVQLPKEGQPDAGLTRDYAQNPLHRFKKPGSKNYQNIYPPSATLHLSNIPATVTEEEIREAFTNDEFDVKAFKFFPKDRKMALLQLSSVEEAVLALIKMHNHQLSESNHLRVSFSKSNI